ncbi:MAG: dihydrolipoyl dehydrogenase, partial [Deltaproteobacteria bacterium]|nr:dihydrolipoyl dehydrogenase [Deltaproteobacteria bacterium]
MAYEYDLAVIGGGPGGYVAAIKAAKEGQRVCLVENAKLGGVCLNEGCIPTKTLIKTANLLHEIRQAERYAITGVDPARLAVSMPALQKRKQSVVGRLVGGIRALLRNNKITLMEGSAAFVDPHTITVNGQSIRAAWCVIATGSSALLPSFIDRKDASSVITSKEALELDRVPASIAVIGGGVIGIEFAYLFNRLGSEVTVLELMDHILPMVDEEVSDLVRKRLIKDGVSIRLGAAVHTVQDNKVLYELDGAQASLEAEVVLMAAGRVPNTAGLNAEGIGLEFDRAAIKTDAGLRTNIPNIYAIGDVNGKSMLAHTASHEGIVAVENMLGRKMSMRYDAIPSCIYLDPEVACIGLTERQSREQRTNV